MKNHMPNDVTNSSHTPPTANEPLLLRPTEAAGLLAISPRKLWELTTTREIPSVRIGRSIRYPREALKAWVSSRQGRRS